MWLWLGVVWSRTPSARHVLSCTEVLCTRIFVSILTVRLCLRPPPLSLCLSARSVCVMCVRSCFVCCLLSPASVSLCLTFRSRSDRAGGGWGAVLSPTSVGGWIPDSRVIHMTFAGSKMELKVRAGDLRAVDRPLQCKLALEALKSDPRILQGKLEPAPPAAEVYGTDGTDAVGPEPGATGFARGLEGAQSALSGCRSGARAAGGGRGGRASLGGAHAEFSSLFGGAAAAAVGLGDCGGAGEDVYYVPELDSTQKHRKKKKKKKTVVIPVAAANGAAGGEGGGGGGSVEYDLPLHVQCVGGKQCSPSLRLKV